MTETRYYYYRHCGKAVQASRRTAQRIANLAAENEYWTVIGVCVQLKTESVVVADAGFGQPVEGCGAGRLEINRSMLSAGTADQVIHCALEAYARMLPYVMDRATTY